jgi:ANTAR domain
MMNESISALDAPAGDRLSHLHSVADERREAHSATAPGVGSAGTGRIDIPWVTDGLRQLTPSVEPARVFSELAGICVPALADACTIDVDEQCGHRYLIRQPVPVPGRETIRPVPAGSKSSSPDARSAPVVGEDTVTTFLSSKGENGPDYTCEVVFRWNDGYRPNTVDAALIGLIVDHTAALVRQERLTEHLAELSAGADGSLRLPGHQRIAAAVGIVMALHHLNHAQATDLLTRASQHTHQSIRGVADAVLRAGAMPNHSHHSAEAAAHRAEQSRSVPWTRFEPATQDTASDG